MSTGLDVVLTELTFVAITTLLNQTESEFSKEIDKKQAFIDDLHAQLRDASGELGDQRRRVEILQAEAKERDARKTKTANLRRAYDEERARLSQMQSQYGQMNGDVEMQLGDADKGLAISDQASSILSGINVSPHQPLVIDRADRQALSSSLPPAHVLRARLNAYRAVNQELDGNVRELQSKSSELARKYRQIISLCTSTPESNVDNVIDNLTRAVESEHHDVELTRVREFLQRVEGV